jgi:hypothetical protein
MSNTYLAKLNAHPRDIHIHFEEIGHVYTVCGEKGTYTSVTTWNHQHFNPFHAENVIAGMLKGRNMKNPQYEYFGMSREEILAKWENAATFGTKMHANIEYYYNGDPKEDDSVEYQYFLNFARDYSFLKPYRTEWCVFDEDIKISGSVDMVFRDENTGEFKIYDWKRSKEIVYETPYKKFATKKCLANIPDTNFWHYALQLNCYAKIFFSSGLYFY